MSNRIVAALLMVMVATPAVAAETRPWNLDGATTAPVADESRSGHWWWPAKPTGEAARSETWGNRGVVYRNLPPAKKAAAAPVEPPPPPPPDFPPGWGHGPGHPVLNNVLFDHDSAEVRPGANGSQAIDELVRELNEHPNDTVVLEGHTCDIGSAAYNLALGQRRADAVRDYMIANGIDPGRVSAVSHGLTRQAVPNISPANRALNRRVIFYYNVVQD